jgi:hypothetical protein
VDEDGGAFKVDFGAGALEILDDESEDDDGGASSNLQEHDDDDEDNDFDSGFLNTFSM